jgi:AcrR family transcriptional regulator
MKNTDFIRLDTYHRRERILDVAADLFAEYGYDAVTTLQLAEGVGCSESSLFKMFPTKDQIYDALFREWATTVQELPVIALEGNSAIKTLRKFFNVYRTRMVSLHPNMRPRLESAVYGRRTGGYMHRVHAILAKQPEFVATCLTPIFAYGQEMGEIRPGDPFQYALLFWSILWGELRLWYDDDYQIPFQNFESIFTLQNENQS